MPNNTPANDNRVERAREFFRQSGKFLYLHERVGEEDAVALLDAFAASETSALTARLEAVEAERDKWLRIAQRLFKERQSLLHGHTYEPSIDDVILDATILENLQENL